MCLLSPSDTAYVRIFISDVNDNKPVFAQTVYEVDVDEDADVGFTILTVNANDEDEGKPAWRWEYSYTSKGTWVTWLTVYWDDEKLKKF